MFPHIFCNSSCTAKVTVGDTESLQSYYSCNAVHSFKCVPFTVKETTKPFDVYYNPFHSPPQLPFCSLYWPLGGLQPQFPCVLWCFGGNAFIFPPSCPCVTVAALEVSDGSLCSHSAEDISHPPSPSHQQVRTRYSQTPRDEMQCDVPVLCALSSRLIM